MPLLSICIPNWNRAKQLKETLRSIAEDPAFVQGNDIEVVISDNASDDDAFEVAQEFADRFPGKCVLRREPRIINSHFNFEKALNAAHGTFLKLHNNNVIFLPGMLSRLLEQIRKNQDSADIFIPLTLAENAGAEIPVTMDQMIGKAGTAITWISCFCVRGAAYLQLDNPFRYWNTNLPQVDILLRLTSQGSRIILLNGDFQRQQQVAYVINRIKKSERNDARIFGRNYFDLLEPYVAEGKISIASFEKEKKRMLWEHIIPYHFDFFHQYFATPQKGFLKYCFPRYRKNFYFYWALIYIAVYYTLSNIIPLHQWCGKIRRKLHKN